MFFNKHHKIGMIGLCLLLLTSQTVLARPISYPDGYMIMQENNANSSNLMVNYSPTANYSIGYTAEYWRNEEWQFHGVQLNYLLKRWNMPKSQANFYFKSATGIAYSDKDNFDHDIRPSGFTGLTFDWEDRDYYASYDNQLVYAKDFQKCTLG